MKEILAKVILFVRSITFILFKLTISCRIGLKDKKNDQVEPEKEERHDA